MKKTLLLNPKFKKIGYLLLIPAVLLFIAWLATDQNGLNILQMKIPTIMSAEILKATEYFTFIENNITDELFCILLIVSLIFIGFSKEKDEDELIAQLRLKSLVNATYINYAILLLSLLFIHNMSFLMVLLINMFTLLIIYTISSQLTISKH